MVKETTLLLGVTGSQSYGLATETSDTDRQGIFIVPTFHLLSLYPYTETHTHKGTEGDITVHELGKFIKLALAANPTILELLYLPSYDTVTEAGKDLIALRSFFLSTLIYKTYGGYALAQAKRLLGGIMSYEFRSRYAKHARHCFRLLDQGEQLLRTGELEVKVSNRDELFALAEQTPEQLYETFEQRFKRFDGIISGLPEHPSIEPINSYLLAVRERYYV